MTIRPLGMVLMGALLIVGIATPAHAIGNPPPDAEPTALPHPEGPRTPVPTPTVPLFATPSATRDVPAPAGDPGTAAPQSTPIPDAGTVPYTPPATDPYASPTPPVPTRSIDPAAPIDHTLVVAVCLDVNANDWCDAGEGVGAMPVIIQDGETSEVRAMTMTDQTGMAQRALRLRADRPLTVAVPYIAQRQTFTPERGPAPFLIQQVPALPGLLP
jgi:hypothetical protein